MMITDSLLLNVQLAMMGIVLVAGLFYLWRMISRVDKKVDDFIEKYAAQQHANQVFQVATQDNPTCTRVTTVDIGLDDADDFMQEVFGKTFSTQPSTPSPPPPVVEIEEEEEPVHKDTISEADTAVTTSTQLTKSKVKKMSLDALKDVCKEKGLSAEGTKVVLQERILATFEHADE